MDLHKCVNCGASPPSHADRCPYCGTAFHGGTPRRGAVLLAADFADAKKLSGWHLYPYAPPNHIELRRGAPAELVATMVLDRPPTAASLIASSASYADVDASVTIRLLEGATAAAGLKIRVTDAGHYYARLSASGYFGVELFTRVNGQPLVVPVTPIARIPSVRQGFGVPNRLRIVAHRSDFRVYVNDQLASSARDDRISNGQVHASVSVSKGRFAFAFSDLVLRDVT